MYKVDSMVDSIYRLDIYLFIYLFIYFFFFFGCGSVAAITCRRQR